MDDRQKSWVCKVTAAKYRSAFESERRAYKKLEGLPGIPRLLCARTIKDEHFLVIEKVSCTLQDFYEDTEMSVLFVAGLAQDLVSAAIFKYHAQRLTVVVVASPAVHSQEGGRPRRY